MAFNLWKEIINTPIQTDAMVDMITHKANLINMNGDSIDK